MLAVTDFQDSTYFNILLMGYGGLLLVAVVLVTSIWRKSTLLLTLAFIFMICHFGFFAGLISPLTDPGNGDDADLVFWKQRFYEFRALTFLVAAGVAAYIPFHSVAFIRRARRAGMIHETSPQHAKADESQRGASTDALGLSRPKWKRRWSVPILFFAGHTVALLWYAANEVPLTGPHADAGSMVWIIWIVVDFPLSVIAAPLAGSASTNAGGIAWILVIGGVQWAIWGWVVQAIVSSIRRRSR